MTRAVRVIVPVWGNFRAVRECLQALKNSDLGSAVVQVVDDGPELEDSKTIEILSDKLGFDYCRNETNHGYTVSVNSALAKSSEEFVVLLNSDTIVPRMWISKLVGWLERYPKIALASPLSNSAGYQSIPRNRPTVAEKLDSQSPINTLPPGHTVETMNQLLTSVAISSPIYLPSCHGFCLAMRRPVIAEIGMFDDKTFPRGYGEEVDLSIRLVDKGWGLALAFDTFIFHHKSGSFTPQMRRNLKESSGAALRRKHGASRLRSLDEDLIGISDQLRLRLGPSASHLIANNLSG